MRRKMLEVKAETISVVSVTGFGHLRTFPEA